MEVSPRISALVRAISAYGTLHVHMETMQGVGLGGIIFVIVQTIWAEVHEDFVMGAIGIRRSASNLNNFFHMNSR